MPADIKAAAGAARMKPLAYMLSIMNDPTASNERRDRMAQAAAPYVHRRPGDIGKKAAAQAAAEDADHGHWGDLLKTPPGPKSHQ